MHPRPPLSGRQSLNTRSAPTLVKRAEGLPTIVGYAAVYYDPADPGTEYRLWSDMVERIRPGAFDRAVKEDDVRGLFNHESCEILGRTVSGTLRLSLDARGLKYEIDPPDTQAGRDTVTSLQRGDVTGSSFAFVPTRTTWEEIRDGATGAVTYVRWIEECQLFDVGPVTYPAYESTESGARSDRSGDDLRAELDVWRSERRAVIDRDYAASIAMELEMAEVGG